MEESGVELYEDIIDYVLYRFHVNTRNYKVFLLSNLEFEIFNYECDVVKSFYLMITSDPEFGYKSYRNKYSKMLTKEYGEVFFQSENDSYISAALIHVDKVQNTITPVYDTIEILNKKIGTKKHVTFLHSLLTENSEVEYLMLLRKERHEELWDDPENNKIYFDVIHETLHMVEHEKPPSKWKFWIKKHMDSEEMDIITEQIFHEWEREF